MNRRHLLQALTSLPFCGSLVPKDPEPQKVVIRRISDRETDDRTLVEVLREARQLIQHPESWQAADYGSEDLTRHSLRGAVIQASRRGPLMSQAWQALGPFYRWKKLSERTHARDLEMLDRAIDFARYCSGVEERWTEPAERLDYVNTVEDFVKWRNSEENIETLGFKYHKSPYRSDTIVFAFWRTRKTEA